MFVVYPHIESEDLRYAYAVGRIRAMETGLFTLPKITRLLETKTADELMKSLGDTDYGSSLPASPEFYETIIRTSRRDLYYTMEKLILDPPVLEFLRASYDIHNIKVLLKAKILEKNADKYLSDFANWVPEELKRVFDEETYDRLPHLIEDGIEEAISLYYTTHDSRTIDIAVDRTYYKWLYSKAEEVKNLFLKTLVKIEIDLTNIKTFLRIKWIKGEKTLLSLSLIGDGFISAEDFLSIFDEPPEVLYHYFEATPYRKLVEDGVSYLYSKGSFTGIEKLSDEHLLEFLMVTKFLAFGVEPLIAYFYTKENEFKIIRMLFVGKLYQIPEDLLKERLPGI